MVCVGEALESFLKKRAPYQGIIWDEVRKKNCDLECREWSQKSGTGMAANHCVKSNSKGTREQVKVNRRITRKRPSDGRAVRKGMQAAGHGIPFIRPIWSIYFALLHITYFLIVFPWRTQMLVWIYVFNSVKFLGRATPVIVSVCVKVDFFILRVPGWQVSSEKLSYRNTLPNLSTTPQKWREWN